ncbi:MAG: LysR family transcriptional regulator [Pseudomonadales bacterium]
MNITHKFDLNLLRVFSAVYAEGHIGRAAKRLSMTQPAVSHAIQRLRNSVGDPLFIRTGKGVEPTARAEEMSASVQDSLESAMAAITTAHSFDPATSNRVFHIGLPDHAVAKYAPLIYGAFSHLAPELGIYLHDVLTPEAIVLIEQGKMDMAAGVIDDLPKRFKSIPLFTSQIVVIASEHNPYIKGKIDLAGYRQARHLIYSGSRPMNSALSEGLAKLGITRNIGMTISGHLAVPSIVSHSDLIATVTRELAEPHAEKYGLQILKPPFDIPDIQVSLLWHVRNDRDAGHQWLREMAVKMTLHERQANGHVASRRAGKKPQRSLKIKAK